MPPERPRAELFADPTAAVVWAAICALDEGAQHEVLRELRARLDDPTDRATKTARKIARGVAALRIAADELGRTPSVMAYRDLRRTRPELRLPADGTVRTWLGGDWNTALERAKLDRVPDVDATVAPEGSRFTREEVVAAINECAEDLGCVPGYGSYQSWAQSPQVRRRPGRRPRSLAPIFRCFGSWSDALIAAGHIPDGTDPRKWGGRSRFTEDQLLDFLDVVRARIGAMPSMTRFVAEREKVMEELGASGSLKVVPGYRPYVNRFGGWRAAQEACLKREAARERE